MKYDFIPLLFAGDINVYSMARAFHQEYGIKSYVFGKYNSGPCVGSEIIEYSANNKVDEQEVFLKIVNDFASKNITKKILLIGCGDSYVSLISRNICNFPDNIIAPYINIDLMNKLTHKERFYEICEENGVDYPMTFVYKSEMGNNISLPFEPPYIIKPSNGIEYWKNPFQNQEKVYKTNSMDELLKTIKLIYASGYTDSIIIQDFIPGDDTFMRVLTNYSDKKGNVKLMCLGHVLLEEHTPHGIGNHAVIITENNNIVEKQFQKFLENMKYIGFSNFDIKYDQRDGKYKVFEINTRQGRSNFYVTAAGANLAKYLVEDYIENKELELKIVTESSLWMVVPFKVAIKYIKPDIYRKQMKLLKKENKMTNPLIYNKDKKFGRIIRIEKSIFSHYFKFKKYLGK